MHRGQWVPGKFANLVTNFHAHPSPIWSAPYDKQHREGLKANPRNQHSDGGESKQEDKNDPSIAKQPFPTRGTAVFVKHVVLWRDLVILLA